MADVSDLIVVGAGPGGSNAAAAALDAGLTVAQIDRYAFPRVKPCAGGLTVKACQSLLIDTQPLTQRAFTSIEFNVFGKRVTRFTHKRPVLTTVVRPEFDNLLVTRNSRSKDFTFYDQERVLHVEWDREFIVHTDRRKLRAHQLVGADGAYGVVNKAFRIGLPKGFATAIEVNIESDIHRLPCFDFGVLPRGYGWVFPKDGHCSVGLYTLARGVKNLRLRLQSYLREKGLWNGESALRTEAFQFPYGGYRLACPEVPVYIVGDAGGFGDAITGEGIYHALESGRLAGQTASEVAAGSLSHRRYYQRLWKTVLPDTFLTYQLSRGFYRDPSLSLGLFQDLFMWRPFVQGYTEGSTFAECLLKGSWLLAKSFANAQCQSARTAH